MRAMVLIAALAAGCAPATPGTPDWVNDVRPILAANCIRCHGSPALGGAPATFRLDVLRDVGRVKGAASMWTFIAARAVAREDMPPRGPFLSPRQKDILDAWKPDPLAPEPGTRPGNHLPTATATIAGPDAAGIYTIAVAITDADRDVVSGELRSGTVVVGELRAGTQTLTWDTSTLRSGAYPLTAAIDDGSGELPLEVGTITVPQRDAAPDLVFVKPSFAIDPAMFTTSDATTGSVIVKLSDVDSDPPFTVHITAVRGGGTPVEIATRENVTPPAEGLAIDFDPSKLDEATTWRFVATVSNPGGTHTVTTPQFIVSHAMPSETFNASDTCSNNPTTVGGIVDCVCAACHQGSNPDLSHVLTGPNFKKIEELRSYRGRAWRKVCQLREMPPKSMTTVVGNVVFSEESRAKLCAWLYAGAK